MVGAWTRGNMEPPVFNRIRFSLKAFKKRSTGIKGRLYLSGSVRSVVRHLVLAALANASLSYLRQIFKQIPQQFQTESGTLMRLNDPDHKAANALLGVWDQYQQEPGSSDWELCCFSGHELVNFHCSSMCSGIPVDPKHSDSRCGRR